MSVPRYYAMYGDVRRLFQSRHKQAWQVFDRDALTDQGEAVAVVLCLNRDMAYKVRDALNQEEKALAR